MAEISDNIGGVEVILRSDDIQLIYDLFERFNNTKIDPMDSSVDDSQVPVIIKPDSDMMVTLSRLIAASTDGAGLRKSDDIVTALQSGMFNQGDIRDVFGFLSQNSEAVSKYATGNFNKSDIIGIVTQLLGVKSNPLFTALAGLVINRIENRKKKKKNKKKKSITIPKTQYEATDANAVVTKTGKKVDPLNYLMDWGSVKRDSRIGDVGFDIETMEPTFEGPRKGKKDFTWPKPKGAKGKGYWIMACDSDGVYVKGAMASLNNPRNTRLVKDLKKMGVNHGYALVLNVDKEAVDKVYQRSYIRSF